MQIHIHTNVYTRVNLHWCRFWIARGNNLPMHNWWSYLTWFLSQWPCMLTVYWFITLATWNNPWWQIHQQNCLATKVHLDHYIINIKVFACSNGVLLAACICTYKMGCFSSIKRRVYRTCCPLPQPLAPLRQDIKKAIEMIENSCKAVSCR